MIGADLCTCLGRDDTATIRLTNLCAPCDLSTLTSGLRSMLRCLRHTCHVVTCVTASVSYLDVVRDVIREVVILMMKVAVASLLSKTIDRSIGTCRFGALPRTWAVRLEEHFSCSTGTPTHYRSSSRSSASYHAAAHAPSRTSPSLMPSRSTASIVSSDTRVFTPA